MNGKTGLFQTSLDLRQFCRGGLRVSRYLDMNSSCLNHLNLGVEVLGHKSYRLNLVRVREVAQEATSREAQRTSSDREV